MASEQKASNDEVDSDGDSNFFVPKELFNADKSNRYTVHEMIGSGSFAKCYRVRLTKSGWEKDYACKVLSKKRIKSSSKLFDAYRAEIGIHLQLGHHDNIVDFIESFHDANQVYTIQSICAQGSLLDLQKRQHKTFDEHRCKYYIQQVINGLAFLHSNRIIHRDLKSANVFLDWRFCARIGDFGFAMRYDSSQANENDEMNTPFVCGTRNFLAPEILTRKCVSFKSDVWAVAVMAYYMRVGKCPFDGRTNIETYQRIVHIDYDLNTMLDLETDLVQFLMDVFDADVSKRPNTDSCMGLPYFSAQNTTQQPIDK